MVLIDTLERGETGQCRQVHTGGPTGVIRILRIERKYVHGLSITPRLSSQMGHERTQLSLTDQRGGLDSRQLREVTLRSHLCLWGWTFIKDGFCVGYVSGVRCNVWVGVTTQV